MLANQVHPTRSARNEVRHAAIGIRKSPSNAVDKVDHRASL
jgi:hypothetical protein